MLTAPLEAIERRVGHARLHRGQGRASIRIVPVQLGVEDAQRREIVSGLQEADLVITGRRAGLQRRRKGRSRRLLDQ